MKLSVMVVALSALAAPAFAQSDLSGLELEDLLRLNVVTASKVEERVKDAPGVVAVITKEEIEAFGAVSLVDILNRATSFQLMSSHLWVQAKSVLRGNLITHADHHILILLNGRPFRDALESNSNWTLYTAFPTGLIERIEVIRGPGSVLYGSNAVSGVVNIITRKPTERSVRVGARAGSFGTGAGSAELGLKGAEWSLLLGADYYREDGWPFAAAANFPVPAVGIRRSEMEYGERNKSVTAFFEYKRFSAQLLYIDAQYDDLGIAPHWMFQGQVLGERSFLDLSYVQPLSGSWDLKVSFDLNDWEKHIRDNTTPGLDDNWDNSIASVLEVAARGKIGEKTNVVLGGLTERRANYDIPDTIPNKQAPGIPGKYSEKHYSAYVQADHSVRDRLKLVSGVQYNRTGSGHTAAVPRLGAILPVADTLTLKALWGQAFRTATPLEEFVNVPGVLRGRDDLRPERVNTFDVQLFLDRARSQSTLTFFHNKYTDVVNRIPAVGAAPGTFTFQNSGVNTIQGLELEHRSSLAKGFFLTGSVTLQDEKEEKLFVPTYMAKAGVSYTGKSLSGGLFHSHFGKPRAATAPLGGVQLNEPAQAINLLSLNLNYKVRTRVPFTVSLYGSNLLGDGMHYTEFARGWTNTLPIGPGRAVYGKLSMSF